MCVCSVKCTLKIDQIIKKFFEFTNMSEVNHFDTFDGSELTKSLVQCILRGFRIHAKYSYTATWLITLQQLTDLTYAWYDLQVP